MKITRYLTAVALCILSAASCTKENIGLGENNGPVEMVLEAYPGEEEPETKTVLGSDAKSIYWEAGDQISLFFGNGENGGSCFTTADGGETASFTGSINAFTAGGEGYTGETTYFWGVYPYKSTTTCDNNSITINIPSVQPGRAGTFAPGVNISVGRSENLKMGFYNVCTSVSFTIAQEGITELLFKAKDGVSIVGDATVEFVSGKPTVVNLANGSDEVRIIPEEGEFEVGQKYYLEFIPITLDGFTATIYNNVGKEATFEYARTKEYARSVPTNVANLDTRVGEWTVRKGNITFADPNFKAYCVEKFDTDGDGEVSFVEAAVVKVVDCSNKGISSMNEIRYFTAMTYLACHENQLTNLDASNNTALTELGCVYNQLTNLDVSKNIALTKLDCYGNQLASLDVSKNTAMTYLACGHNQLTSLDVSNNTALSTLYCNENQLTSLDFSNNTALSTLYCNGNQLASLDFSKNTALTSLSCHSNQLTSLDVSKNTALTTLDCYSNQLTSLDVCNNTSLTRLTCHSNQLASLDISNNTALTSLSCSINKLTRLDVSNNTALTILACVENQLTSLEIAKNTALTILYCYSNQLTSLDVSNNTALEYLSCYSNQLTSLDVSKNTALRTLYCSPMNDENGQNLLQTLYIYNGQEINGITTRRSSSYIPDETVITDADPGTNEGFGDGEELDDDGYITFADPNFKAVCVKLCDTNKDGEISYSEAASLENLDVSNRNLTSLDGIQFFISLKSLWCGRNQITSLDISKNTALTSLRCDDNQLTSLDVSKNTALVYFTCEKNQLTSLDVSNNTALTTLECGHNKISSLDVSKNTVLQSLTCSFNRLTSLDVSNNTSLSTLYCESNQLMNLNLGNNTALTHVYCFSNLLTSLDVSKNTALIMLACQDNLLTSLDVSKNSALRALNCQENQFQSLDVSNNTALTDLYCNGNQLTSLDVSKNTALAWLHCDSNQLTTLDVSKNTALTNLDCYRNQLTSLDVSNNTALITLICSPMNDAAGNNLLQTLYIYEGQDFSKPSWTGVSSQIPSETSIVVKTH